MFKSRKYEDKLARVEPMLVEYQKAISQLGSFKPTTVETSPDPNMTVEQMHNQIFKSKQVAQTIYSQLRRISLKAGSIFQRHHFMPSPPPQSDEPAEQMSPVETHFNSLHRQFMELNMKYQQVVATLLHAYELKQREAQFSMLKGSIDSPTAPQPLFKNVEQNNSYVTAVVIEELGEETGSSNINDAFAGAQKASDAKQPNVQYDAKEPAQIQAHDIPEISKSEDVNITVQKLEWSLEDIRKIQVATQNVSFKPDTLSSEVVVTLTNPTAEGGNQSKDEKIVNDMIIGLDSTRDVLEAMEVRRKQMARRRVLVIVSLIMLFLLGVGGFVYYLWVLGGRDVE